MQQLIDFVCHLFKQRGVLYHLIGNARHGLYVKGDGLLWVDQRFKDFYNVVAIKNMNRYFSNTVSSGKAARGFNIDDRIHETNKVCLLTTGRITNFVKNQKVAEEKMDMFRNRLAKVFRHVGKQAKRQNISCYRVYDHDLPEFPFCIEFYGDKLYVAEYKRRHNMTDEAHDEWMEKSLEIICEVLTTTRENIFLKLRQRKPGRLGQYQKFDEVQHEFVVEENGLKFIVNLSDYLDTGLFLDHRLTREKIRAESKDKRVLNLFAYTGSFSVYAAAGGAYEVVTVDLSKTYLNWAEKNIQLNGYDVSCAPLGEGGFKFIHADVMQYLKTLPADHFDLIIMDPPTFSNSKRMDDFLDIQRDHVELINDCLHSLKEGGVLYFSTNFRRFAMDKESIRARAVKDITKATSPFDFEGKLFRWCFYITK